MTSTADLNDAIQRLEQRRRRARMRLESLSTRFQSAAGDVGTALEQIEQSGAESPELAQSFVTSLQRAGNEKLQEYAGRLDAIAKDAAEYTTHLTKPDLGTIADETKSSAEAFIEKAVGTIDDRLKTLLEETLEDCVADLDQARTEMLTDLSNHATTFESEAEAWQDTLRSAKDVLEARLDELTELDFEEAWEQLGAEMNGALLVDIERTQERILAVRTKIERSMDKIAQIVEMFGKARETKDRTVESAGTALQTISAIFTDLEAILDSVK